MGYPQWLRVLATRRMLICVFTGFSSGLPLYVLLNLVPAWLFTEGISLKQIGALTLIQLPYTWKFLWAPLLDRYPLPHLGRRRGWMLATQVALLCAITAIGGVSLALGLKTVVLLTLLIAFLSATQDIALDAFRREILSDDELGLGNSVHVNAYRVAGLGPGSLAFVLADFLPWPAVFAITALFMVPGMVMVLMSREPVVASPPKSLRAAVVEPWREFMTRAGMREALLILLFIFLYKLGDSLSTALATPFYLSLGYTKTQIGLVAKNAGLWPAVIGGLLGGLWMVRLGINRALWIFGVVQFVSIFGFAWLAWLGPQNTIDVRQLTALAGVIGLEALGVGLGTVAFVAFIARTTHPQYTATQFALFTSLAAVPRAFINSGSGYLVTELGWLGFFLLCALLAIPGMLLLLRVAPWRQPVASCSTAPAKLFVG